MNGIYNSIDQQRLIGGKVQTKISKTKKNSRNENYFSIISQDDITISQWSKNNYKYDIIFLYKMQYVAVCVYIMDYEIQTYLLKYMIPI